MRKIVTILAALGWLTVTSTISYAQEATGEGSNTDETTTEDVATVSLIEEIKAEQSASISKKVSADLEDIVEIKGQKMRIAEFSQLRLEGVMSTRKTQEGHAGKASWKSLALDQEDGTVKRKFLSGPLASDMLIEDVAEPGTQLSAKGDVTSLIADAKALLGEQLEETKVEAEEEESADDSAGRTTAAGGDSGTQFEAGGLERYTPTATAETLIPDTVYGTSVEGCEVRLSEDFATVYETSKVTENGSPVGECNDSGRTFTVNFSENSCPLDYVQDEGRAYVLYKAFYLKDGETRYLQKDGQECFRHQDKFYERKFNAEGSVCTDLGSITADQETGKMMVRGEPYAVRQSGAHVALGVCEDVEEVDITWEDGDCALSDDWSTTPPKSFQKQQAVYYYNDVRRVALGCVTRSAKSYDMEKVDANCPVQVVGSGEDEKVIKAYDFVVYVDSAQVLRESCRPDTSEVAVTYNTDACRGTFIHDADISYGTVRREFKDPDTGQMRSLSGCERDLEREFEHHVQVTSWRNVFEDLEAWGMMETYINSDVGHRTVKTQESDVATPFTFVSTKYNDPADEFFFEACRQFEKTGTFDIYERPDGEEYRRLVSEGEALDHGDKCSTQVEWDEENPTYHRTGSLIAEGREPGGMPYRTFSCKTGRSEVATKKVVRIDGEVMSTASNTGTVWQQSHTATTSNPSWSYNCNLYSWGPYPSEITFAQEANFEAGWGW